MNLRNVEFDLTKKEMWERLIVTKKSTQYIVEMQMNIWVKCSSFLYCWMCVHCVQYFFFMHLFLSLIKIFSFRSILYQIIILFTRTIYVYCFLFFCNWNFSPKYPNTFSIQNMLINFPFVLVFFLTNTFYFQII